VLGTRSDQVKAAIFQGCTWVVPEKLAKGGSWSLLKDNDLRAAPNNMGFISAYRLTQDSGKYNGGYMGIKLALGDGKPSIDETMSDGLSYERPMTSMKRRTSPSPPSTRRGCSRAASPEEQPVRIYPYGFSPTASIWGRGMMCRE